MPCNRQRAPDLSLNLRCLQYTRTVAAQEEKAWMPSAGACLQAPPDIGSSGPAPLHFMLAGWGPLRLSGAALSLGYRFVGGQVAFVFSSRPVPWTPLPLMPGGEQPPRPGDAALSQQNDT